MISYIIVITGVDTMISLKNIFKTYHAADEDIHALKDISISLRHKGLVMILGPSGCGKTTLLNLMGGLDQPSSGELFMFGKSRHDMNEDELNTYRNHKVGFIFQNYYLIPHLNIIDNVALPLLLSGFDEKTAKEKAKEQLIRLGLKDKLFKKPSELSGGQQQRAAIARALIHEPNIILADEPTGSLDHESSLDIMHIIKTISKDRLVVMVTHNMELAESFGDEIIEMRDGQVLSTHEAKTEDTLKKEHIHHKVNLSIKTSFFLSFGNLLKRKYRTLLTLLAASISVIGMSLVLAVSFGFNRFVEDRKVETLNAFPIRVERVSFVVPLLDDHYRPNLETFPDDGIVHLRNIQYEFQTINTLTPEYYNYVQDMNQSLYTYIHYDYRVISNFIVNNDSTYSDPSSYLRVSEVSESYIASNYDILTGTLPSDDTPQIFIVLDRYNRLSKDIAQAFGFSGDDDISLDVLLDLEVFWVPNDVMYTQNGENFTKASLGSVYNHAQRVEIPIVSIIRIKDKFELDPLKTGIYYTKATQDLIRESSIDSEIVVAQISSSTSVIDGSSLTSSQKDQLLRSLGYATYPLSYAIYSRSFQDKDIIVNYLRGYNQTVSASNAIEPLDVAGIGLATMRVVIDSTTWILLSFAIISLIISNFMIGIMTYTSVIERTKEIGLLRSIGASKKDVKRIFYAETFMIGFLSALIGLLLLYLLMPLINLGLYQLTGIKGVGYLPIIYGLMILILNTLLTSIAGLIPANIASKKDPIIALRSQ